MSTLRSNYASILVTLVIISIVGFCENVHGLEVRIPGIRPIIINANSGNAGGGPLSNIVNRITNTTYGIVRGGLNLFNNGVDRIISTVGSIDDRLQQLVEEFRSMLARGIPELSIPILEPLHVDRIEFDVSHEAAALKGKVEDVTVKHISKFRTDGAKLTDLGNLRFKLDLNVTFPHLSIDGNYTLNGLVGNTFAVFGKGKFWLHLIDFKLAITAVIKFDVPHLRLTSLGINIKLRKLENYFENLMNDKEVGDLFNKAIAKMAPEALDILWPDIKKPVELEVAKYVNSILENTTVTNLARRIFNIR